MASPQPLFFGADNVKSGGFLDRFDRHLNRVPNAGRTRKAVRACPKAPWRVQPTTFAFCSSPEAVPAVSVPSLEHSLQASQTPADQRE
jgi:hypothetical protein